MTVFGLRFFWNYKFLATNSKTSIRFHEFLNIITLNNCFWWFITFSNFLSSFCINNNLFLNFNFFWYEFTIWILFLDYLFNLTYNYLFIWINILIIKIWIITWYSIYFGFPNLFIFFTSLYNALISEPTIYLNKGSLYNAFSIDTISFISFKFNFCLKSYLNKESA